MLRQCNRRSTQYPLTYEVDQARRQDSVTGGGGSRKKILGGHEQFILSEFERGTGAREIYPSLNQLNEVRSKDSKGFSGRNRKFKRFFRPKTGDLQKNIGLYPENVMKSVVSPQKTPIWASIYTPVAPILLISSGRSPRLGGHIFHLGGQGPSKPPCVAASVADSETSAIQSPSLIIYVPLKAIAVVSVSNQLSAT